MQFADSLSRIKASLCRTKWPFEFKNCEAPTERESGFVPVYHQHSSSKCDYPDSNRSSHYRPPRGQSSEDVFFFRAIFVKKKRKATDIKISDGNQEKR